MLVHGLAATLCFLCAANPLVASPAVAPLYLTSYPRSNNFADADYYDEYYHLTVSVGTPAVDFNLTLANTLYGFETGWAGEGNILFGKDYCKCGLCSDAVFQPKRNEYDVNASSTAQVTSEQLFYATSLGDPYENPYCEDHAKINGTSFSDVVSVSKKQLGFVPFDVIEQISSLNRKWKADGIFRAKAAPDATLGGHLIFGATEVPSMCHSNWTKVTDGFKPFIRNVLIGSKSVPMKDGGLSPARIRLDSAFIRVNYHILESITRLVGAEYDFESDTYVVRCAAVATMPDIVFHLTDLVGHNTTYNVPASVYTRQMQRDASKCRLMFDDCQQGDDLCNSGYEWALGSSFLRPYCHRMVYKDASTTIYSITKAKF